MKFISFLIVSFLSSTATAGQTMYVECKIKEPDGRKELEVTVKFAIKNFEPYEGEGDLVDYPGLDEDSLDYQGAIFVSPLENSKDRYTKMTNLNGQGGDLRIENGNIRLWGDGAGYQFTELVLWDDGDESIAYTKGYVRDYGPTYGDSATFQQFIICTKSDTVL